MVETNPSNMEGNVCQLFVDSSPSLGEWITVHYQWWQSEKLHCGDVPGILISFISAGIRGSQKTTHPELSFTLCPLHDFVLSKTAISPPSPFYKNQPLCWETDCIDCEGASKTGSQSWWSFHSIRCELAIFMGLMEAPLPCQCKHRPLCSSPGDPHYHSSIGE